MEPPLVSPARPIAPPMKKQRAGATPATRDKADDRLKQRRADLDALRQQSNQFASTGAAASSRFDGSRPPPTEFRFGGRAATTSSAPLRGGGRPAPPAQPPTALGLSTANATSSGAPPVSSMPPQGSNIARVRHSDIFPSVPKIEEPPPEKQPPTQRPPVPSRPPAAPPESLARRLDASFLSGASANAGASTNAAPQPPAPKPATSRSSSAPPRRPRPPPPRGPSAPPRRPAPAEPPSRKTVSFGETTTATTTTSRPPPRDFVGRPPPTTPAAGSLGFFQADKASGGDEPTATPAANKKAAGSTPFPTKAVSLEETPSPTQPETKKKSDPTAGHTPFPTKAASSEETPPSPSQAKKAAGHTPFPRGDKPAEKEEEVPVDSPPAVLNLSQEPEPVETPPAAMEPPKQETLQLEVQPSPPLSLAIVPKSPELRMQKEMVRLEKDKTEALTQVAQLQDEVQKLKETQAAVATAAVSPDLTAVVQLADQQGETKALQWAREQVGDGKKKVGFAAAAGTLPLMSFMPSSPTVSTSSLAGALSPPSMLRSNKRRAPTPHPKRNRALNGSSSNNTAGDEGGVDGDGTTSAEEERAVLVKAADSTEHEYENLPLATFIIRRPFGRATERDLWFSAGQLSNKIYEKGADPFAPCTLEVVAHIEADNSLLALHGDAMVRHQTADGNWKDYGNADEEPMGSVLYIDSDANEKDYSLDEVFQGARAVREHYCSAFSCVAFTIRRTMKEQSKLAPPASAADPPLAGVGMPPPTNASTPPAAAAKTPTKDAGVGTEDIPFPPPDAAAKKQGDDAAAAKPKEPEKKKKKKKSPPPEEPSPGVLVTFIGMFFNAIFSLIWNIFVGLPLRIMWTAIVMTGAAFLIATFWLFFADNDPFGSLEMGAGMHRGMYNPPGIA